MRENEKPEPKICKIGQIAKALGSMAIIMNMLSGSGVSLVGSTESLNSLEFCNEERCALWRQLHPATSREDHSGGKEMIFDEGRKTNRHPRREGPGGSTGYWILDASGYCGLGGKP